MARKRKKHDSALKGLSKTERKRLNGVIKDYLSFLNKGNTPERTVDGAIAKARSAGLVRYEEGMEKEDLGDGFYMNDSTGRQFSIVLFGERTAEEAGISMLVSHTDSPCFNLREHPIREGPEGLMLLTKPYGGIWRHQWLDTVVKIIGRFSQNGNHYDLELEGLLSDRSIHITSDNELGDDYAEIFPHLMYKIVTGLEDEGDLLKLLEAEGLDDATFFRNTWYVVPDTLGKRVGDLLVGFGHDDRVGVYSSVKAALESKRRVFPTIIHGVGREEIGSTGVDGSMSTFLESSVDALLKAEGIDEKDISAALQRRVLSSSRMISADVDVAMSAYDNIDDDPRYDEEIIAKFNKGVSITKLTGDSFQYEGNVCSDEMTRYVLDILDKANVLYQTTENPSKLEYGGGGTVAVFYANRGIPVIDVGPPVANMHGKNPYLHVGDLMQTIKAYKAFVQRKK